MSERARWSEAEPLHLRNNLSLETLSALCVLRNRRKAHSNTSSTATRRGIIDSRDVSLSMVEPPEGPQLVVCANEISKSDEYNESRDT